MSTLVSGRSEEKSNLTNNPTGALESWGLSMYQESSVLYNSAKGNTSSRDAVLSAMAHETVVSHKLLLNDSGSYHASCKCNYRDK